jgi:predicted O-methyltransferase YrrM
MRLKLAAVIGYLKRVILFNPISKKLFNLFAYLFKEELMESLGGEYNRMIRFSDVRPPKRIKCFEDLCFLFWVSPLNRGLIRMDLDEAAYIFKLVRSLNEPLCVEIGRFKGGSTFLIASAMNGGKLISLDLHLKMMLKKKGGIYDKELKKSLESAGLRNRVDLIVADSKSYHNEDLSVDFLFIDGDHTYEGVKSDFLHWVDAVKPGGHILLHDAASLRPHTTVHTGVEKLVKELRQSDNLIIAEGKGSIAHFVKR